MINVSDDDDNKRLGNKKSIDTTEQLKPDAERLCDAERLGLNPVTAKQILEIADQEVTTCALRIQLMKRYYKFFNQWRDLTLC